MVQRIKKEHHEKEMQRKNFYLSIFILIIMVSSIIGYAMMSGNDTTSSQTGGIPKELELKQVEQEGQSYFVAVKNYELFVFENIDGYDAREDMGSLANQIKGKSYIKIYVDEGFDSPDALFMVDKILKGLQINSEKIVQNSCDENTLVLTNNKSFEGNCMKFISDKGEEYSDVNVLIYYLVQ